MSDVGTTGPTFAHVVAQRAGHDLSIAASPFCNALGTRRDHVAVAVPAANLSGAQEIIDRASRLSERDVARLASAQRRTIGYLGLKRAWQRAMDEVKEAITSSNRGAEVEQASGEAFFAVITALTSAAKAKGRDTSAVAAAVEAYRSFHDSKELRSVMRRVAGRRASMRIGLAGLAATTAVTAALTWDLAADGDQYTPSHRQLLVRPWLKVAELPACLRS